MSDITSLYEQHVDAMLDIIYDVVNELLVLGEYDLVNKLLILRMGGCQMDYRLGWLTATLSYAHVLPARQEFYDETYQRLEDDPERDNILKGLG